MTLKHLIAFMVLLVLISVLVFVSTLLPSPEAKNVDIKKGISETKKEDGELKIQGKDGKIREARGYGNDPCPPKDEN